MRAITETPNTSEEVSILARVLGNEQGQMPVSTARYYLTLAFSEADKARMHDLAIRNQEGLLSVLEQQEMAAYAKAGSLLSILKSRARRVLKVKPKKHANS